MWTETAIGILPARHAEVMIPLIVAGAVSLVSNVADAWKAHAESVAAAKAANPATGANGTDAAKGAGFQQSLKNAAAQLAATEEQKEKALPADIQSVTGQIFQSSNVQSMARTSPSGTVNLQFNSSGDLFASQTNGAMRRIAVSPDLRQQLQQLNGTLLSPGAAAYHGVAHANARITSRQLPVQVNLAAV